MKIKLTISLFLLSVSLCGYGQATPPWSQRMASMAMAKWGLGNPSSWTYEKGLILKSVETVYEHTSNPIYFQYIQDNINYFVTTRGNISTYNPSDYNIDNINMGRSLLFLFNKTGETKYKTAAGRVRNQLLAHPRTSDGGFWHKQIYPHQMWLDGLYMGEPFYAEYSGMFNEPANYDDIAKQIILMEKHARDSNTGLLYHGWDESKNQSWADPVTGCSPNFWGRALGWYAMSLVDVLDYFPTSHSKRDTIVNILKRLSTAVVNYQDPATGLWYQVVDKGGQAGNYKEASASCMFVYALAKGYRKGYLDETMFDAAVKGFEGILNNFVSVDAQNVVHLNNICRVAGLGGNPYRDGSYAYYIGEPIVTDDPKGVGAFILASIEIEKAEEITTSIFNKEQIEVLVSPNPATDKVIVSSTSLQNAFTYTLFNSLGEQMLSSEDPIIDLSGLASGIYYLKIHDHQRMAMKKIIKQ